MQCLAFNNKQELIQKNDKDFKKIITYQSNDKLAYVLASDIATFIQIKGPIPKSTVEKMLNVDLKNYQVNKAEVSKVKKIVYDKLEKNFKVHLIELNISDYDDSEFIKEYELKSTEIFK